MHKFWQNYKHIEIPFCHHQSSLAVRFLKNKFEKRDWEQSMALCILHLRKLTAKMARLLYKEYDVRP